MPRRRAPARLTIAAIAVVAVTAFFAGAGASPLLEGQEGPRLSLASSASAAGYSERAVTYAKGEACGCLDRDSLWPFAADGTFKGCLGCTYAGGCCCAPGGAKGTTTRVTKTVYSSTSIRRTTIRKVPTTQSRFIKSVKRGPKRELVPDSESTDHQLEKRQDRALCPICPPGSKLRKQSLFSRFFSSRAVEYCCPAKDVTVTVTVTRSRRPVTTRRPVTPYPERGNGTITGRLWYDNNKDSLFSPRTDTLIASRWALIRRRDGVIIGRFRTNSDGYYTFTTPGLYRNERMSIALMVAPQKPVAYFYTGSNGNAIKNIGVPPARIGVIGFIDTNRDLAFTSGVDVPTPNIVVDVKFADNNTLFRRGRLNGDGVFSFETQRYPYIKLVVSALAGKAGRGFRTDGNGNAYVPLVMPGATIRGSAFTDWNNDDTQQPTEPIAVNTTFAFRFTNGSLLRVITTDALGNFRFTTVPYPSTTFEVFQSLKGKAIGRRLLNFTTDAQGNSPFVAIPATSIVPPPPQGVINGTAFVDRNLNKIWDDEDPFFAGLLTLKLPDRSPLGSIPIHYDHRGAFTFSYAPALAEQQIDLYFPADNYFTSFGTDKQGNAIGINVLVPGKPWTATTTATPRRVYGTTTATQTEGTTGTAATTEPAMGASSSTAKADPSATTRIPVQSSTAPGPGPSKTADEITSRASSTATQPALQTTKPPGPTIPGPPTSTVEPPSSSTYTPPHAATTTTPGLPDTLRARIMGEAWYDLNRNSLREAGEPAYAGRGISVQMGNGSTFVDGYTDSNGAFMEAVQVVIGMKLNAIADDGTRSRAFATDVRGNATFRLPIPPASIQGVLFFDLNENGKKDPTEPWASGTVFEVTKLDGTSLGKVTTNVTGGFLLFQAAFPDESLYLIGNPNRTVYSNFATDEKGNAVVIVPIKPGHVSGAVYWDFNNNGVKDGDEPDAANVSIVIKFANGTVVGTAMSDAQGIFDTAVIAHRNATLVVVAGRNKVVREFSTDSDGSAQLSLGMPGAMIQGVGWYDWNKNGVRDPTEWTLDGTNFLEIKYLASRQLLARLTPNDTGGFSWSGVPSPNTGFVIVGQQNVDLKVFFTDAEGSANLLVPILPSRLSGRQYYDLDRNGNWTAGIDKGVANQGFLVLLTDGELYVNVTTGADGGFFVEPPGPMFNEPMTLVLASDPTVVVRSFQTDGFGNVDLNMPLEPADITGIAWMDVNRDGVQDQAEPPLNNSAVDIMWPNGTLLVRALTDADGAFHATTVPFPGQNFTVFTPSGSPVTTFLTDGNGDATLKVAIPPPLISGKLWYSAKGSGAFDPSTDMALADKALQLRFPNSTAYLNFTTDPNGEFMLLPFNVAPRVSVAVIDPTSPTTPLGSITLDQYGSGRVELPLAVPPQYIYVNVWFDANSDLVYNSGDTPYRLKVMQLVFANGTVYGMGTTLANGTLVFKVGVVERHALLKVVPADDTTMVLGSFTTTILGGAVHDIALPLPTFSGQVFYDFDGNKNYSNGDVPMSTEMIMFMLPNGVAQSNTTTLADGTFNTITSPSVGLTLTVVRASAKTVVLGAFKTDPLGRAVITLPLPPGVIRGQAFFDLNKNGVQDFGEPPLSTSSLNLAHPDGSILAALQTNTSGGFKHTMVPLPNQPLSVVVGSSMILTNFTTLATGDANIAVAIPAPKISGQLWWDFVQDGKYDAAKDQGVVNERLLLLLANGTQYANTSTLMDGAFTFTSSRPMINSIMTIVKASNPAVVLATITTDEIGTLVGVVIPLTPGVIEGYAWVDVNKNDVRDPGEPPLNNSFIDVKSTNGTMFVRIPTDATGTYKAPVPAFPNHNFTLVLSSGSPVKSITTDGQGSSNAPVAIPPPFITLKMFYDGNNNSLWEADRDVVLPGRKLVLKFAGNGTMYTNVTTDPNGEFTYLPDVAAPNFRLNVFDSADVFKILGTIVLDSFGSGHVDLPVPPPPPFINATVWFDMNNNGARDSTDVPYGNMPIALIDSNGTVYLSGTMLANGSISFPVTSPLRSTKLGLVSLDDPATIIAEMTTDNLGSAAVSAPLPVPVISGQAVVANLNVPATNVEFLVLFANGSTYAKITSDSAGAFFYITTSPRPVTNFTVALASNPSVPIDSVRTDGLGNAANLEITLAPGTIRGDVCLEVRVDGVCDSNDVPYTSPVDLVRASDGSVVTRLTLEANGTFEYVMVPQFKANFSIIGPDGRLLKSISTDGAGNAVVQVPIIPGRLVADVFYDISGNGVRETGEPGYVARPVDIQYANGTLFATMTTNSTGGFSHPIYPQPSTIFFIVTSDGLVNKQFTTDSSGNAVVIFAIAPGTIHGQAWFEIDQNGVFDSTDIPNNNSFFDITWPTGVLLTRVSTDAQAGFSAAVIPYPFETFVIVSPKGQVWKTFTTDGSGNALVDVAVPVPYITGRLYSDADQNLAFSAGDSAYTNVTLQIKFANGTVYRMLPTDTNGQFAFLPEFGAPNTTLTVIEPSTGQQLANITLDGVGSGHANLPVAPAHISGRIFFDLNSDSSYSAGTDVPYGPGQSLELHRKDGSLFSIATIGADGSFVLATDPPAPNTLFDIVAAADPSVVLAANVGTDRLGFGVKQIPLAPSHIIATVWWDVNEDGTYGSGDTFMANEAIELLKSDGTVYATGTTLTNGTVVINPTNPAPFETLTVVRAADPANVLETLVTDARGNGQVQIKLIPGHFAGEAFWDLNKDGVQDSGEPAFANTYLDFVWPNGSSFHRFTTAANGTFGYKTIVYANQNFDVILPNGVNVQTVTTDNAGDAVSISIPIQPAVLSANLWFDYLSNGVLDANDDKPVANLPLVFKFANGSTYATVTTDGNGAFSYTAALALSAVAPNTNIQIVDPTNANVLGAIATDNFGSGHVDVALPPPPPVLTGAIVFDMNRDGSRDSSDVPYLASKQVVLLFGNGSVYMNGSVVADGNFTFLVTDPQPGETFAMISPLDPAQGLGTITADQYGASNQDVLLQPSRITGVVFYDVTQDGLFSGPPDIPAEGEHLVLKLANGTIYGNISTAPDGSFVFDPLHPLPTTNFTIVRSTALNVILGAVFTDPLGNGNAEVPLVPAEIQGVLFYDTNKNGVHDAGETPVNDTLISIAMPNGTELTGSPVLTNSTGGFSLLTVPHPSAVLNLVLPSGYVLKNFTTTNTGAATVVGPLAVPYISLHVWTDYLSNRTFDAGFDEPIINKTLNLVLPNGTVYAQLTTDQAGNASYLAPLADVLPGQTLDIVNPDDSSVWGNITLDRWGAGHQQVPVPAPVPTISGVMFWDINRNNATDLSSPAVDVAYQGSVRLLFANGSLYREMSLSGGFGNAGHFEFIDTSDVPSKTFSVVSSDEPTVILANFTTDWYGRANIWLPLPSPVFKGRLWIDADNDGIFDSGDIDLPNTGISLFFANGTLFENGTTLGDGTFAFNLTEPVQGQQFSVSLQTGQVLINPVTTNSMGNAFADVRLLSEDVRAITVSSSTRNVYIGGAVVSSNFLFGGISVANSDVTGVTCDCVVGMMDNTGSAAWIRSFGSADGNEKVMGIAVDDSEAATGSGAGDVYIVGSFTSGSLTLDGTVLQNTGSVGTPDIFVARLDGRNGSVIWAKGFGTANADEALGVAVGVTSAHIYVVGYYTDTALTLGANSLANVGLKDGFVAQLATADGSVGWAHSQSSSGVDMTHSVAVDRSGSVGAIVVGGQFEKGDVQVGQTGSWTAQGGDADAFMATYNPSTGAYLHGRAWGGSGSDVLISLAVHPGSGAIYATGSSSSTSVTFGGAGPDPATKPRAGKSIWVAKHNGTGAPGWYKVFQGAGVGDDGSFGIQVDLMSEAVYIVGTLGSSGGLPWGSQNVTSRMFVGQLSPQGTAINATEIAVAYHSIFNHAWALHVDRRSNIWVGGGAATMQFASLGAPASTSVTALQQTAFLALYDEGLASQSAAAELQVLGSGGFTPGMEEFTAFDGSLATYVDSGSTANPWFGLDLKRPRTIHKIRWHCRASELSLCAGATFEAASSSNFASATSLYQQTSPPQADWMTIDLSGTTQYQYVRMVPATGTNGSRTVEMEVYAA